MATDTRGTLNPYQQNRLLTTFHYIDRLLTDIEHVLSSAGSGSIFPRHLLDLSSEQKSKLESFNAALRRRIEELAAEEGLKRERPQSALARLSSAESEVRQLQPAGQGT